MRLLSLLTTISLASSSMAQVSSYFPDNFVMNYGAAPGCYSYCEITGECDEQILDDIGNVRANARYDTAGIAHGMWRGYYQSGALQVVGRFDHGMPARRWSFYYEDGTLQAEGEMGKGSFEIGCAGSENYTEAGAHVGLWKYFYPSGKLNASIDYRGDARHGQYREYFESGQLKSTGIYVENAKNGIWESYHENGQLAEKAYFKYHRYYEDDTRWWNYECPAGDWTWYDEAGKVTARKTYSAVGELLEGDF